MARQSRRSSQAANKPREHDRHKLVLWEQMIQQGKSPGDVMLMMLKAGIRRDQLEVLLQDLDRLLRELDEHPDKSSALRSRRSRRTAHSKQARQKEAGSRRTAHSKQAGNRSRRQQPAAVQGNSTRKANRALGSTTSQKASGGGKRGVFHRYFLKALDYISEDQYFPLTETEEFTWRCDDQSSTPATKLHDGRYKNNKNIPLDPHNPSPHIRLRIQENENKLLSSNFLSKTADAWKTLSLDVPPERLKEHGANTFVFADVQTKHNVKLSELTCPNAFLSKKALLPGDGQTGLEFKSVDGSTCTINVEIVTQTGASLVTIQKKDDKTIKLTPTTKFMRAEVSRDNKRILFLQQQGNEQQGNEQQQLYIFDIKRMAEIPHSFNKGEILAASFSDFGYSIVICAMEQPKAAHVYSYDIEAGKCSSVFNTEISEGTEWRICQSDNPKITVLAYKKGGEASNFTIRAHVHSKKKRILSFLHDRVDTDQMSAALSYESHDELEVYSNGLLCKMGGYVFVVKDGHMYSCQHSSGSDKATKTFAECITLLYPPSDQLPVHETGGTDSNEDSEVGRAGPSINTREQRMKILMARLTALENTNNQQAARTERVSSEVNKEKLIAGFTPATVQYNGQPVGVVGKNPANGTYSIVNLDENTFRSSNHARCFFEVRAFFVDGFEWGFYNNKGPLERICINKDGGLTADGWTELDQFKLGTTVKTGDRVGAMLYKKSDAPYLNIYHQGYLWRKYKKSDPSTNNMAIADWLPTATLRCNRDEVTFETSGPINAAIRDAEFSSTANSGFFQGMSQSFYNQAVWWLKELRNGMVSLSHFYDVISRIPHKAKLAKIAAAYTGASFFTDMLVMCPGHTRKQLKRILSIFVIAVNIVD